MSKLGMKQGELGPIVREMLINIGVDDCVRFPKTHQASIRQQMADLRVFGDNGKKYRYTSVSDPLTRELVVVRLG